MKAVPGTLQDGGAPFLTTHWSVVAACSDLTTGAAHAALTQLCRDYWPPLYSFVRRRGYSRADAQDLVQGFFAYLLQSKAYAQSDRNNGKFRSSASDLHAGFSGTPALEITEALQSHPQLRVRMVLMRDQSVVWQMSATDQTPAQELI